MRLLARLLPILLLLAAALPVPAEVIDHPDLSGEWVLNEKASDDPDTIMRRARGAGGGNGDMPGGGGGGKGGGGRGGGGRPEAEGASGGPGAGMLERYRALSVFHEAGEIDITDGMDISRLLHIDGQAVRSCVVEVS